MDSTDTDAGDITLTMGELTFGTPPDGVTPEDEAERRRIEQRDNAPEADPLSLEYDDNENSPLNQDAETRRILYQSDTFTAILRDEGLTEEDLAFDEDIDPYDVDPIAFELRRIADCLEWFINNQVSVLSKG